MQQADSGGGPLPLAVRSEPRPQNRLDQPMHPSDVGVTVTTENRLTAASNRL